MENKGAMGVPWGDKPICLDHCPRRSPSGGISSWPSLVPFFFPSFPSRGPSIVTDGLASLQVPLFCLCFSTHFSPTRSCDSSSTSYRCSMWLQLLHMPTCETYCIIYCPGPKPTPSQKWKEEGRGLATCTGIMSICRILTSLVSHHTIHHQSQVIDCLLLLVWFTGFLEDKSSPALLPAGSTATSFLSLSLWL